MSMEHRKEKIKGSTLRSGSKELPDLERPLVGIGRGRGAILLDLINRLPSKPTKSTDAAGLPITSTNDPQGASTAVRSENLAAYRPLSLQGNLSEECPPIESIHHGNYKQDESSIQLDGGPSHDLGQPAVDIENESVRTIIVRGANGLSKDMVELFFENKKKTDGGPIESIETDDEEDALLITFEETDVADRILKRSAPLCLESRVLSVERPPQLDLFAIKVKNIPQTVSLELLTLYFENKKKSGGGEIEKVDMDDEFGEAVIRFKESEVRERVLNNKTPLVLQECELAVASVRQAKQLERDPRVILVTGIHEITEDFLSLYLENKKKSGGGEIESINFTEELGQAIVTFVDAEDAQRLVEKGSLAVKDCILTIQPYVMCEPVGRPLKSAKTDHQEHQMNVANVYSDVRHINTFEIRNLKPSINIKQLRMLLKKEIGVEISDVERLNGSAVIKLTKSRDAMHLLKKKTITVEGQVCEVVPLDTRLHDQPGFVGPTSIIVTGISEGMKLEAMEQYFNNRRRSGGWDVTSVYWKPEDKKAIISFETMTAVESVLSKQNMSPLTLMKQELHVEKLEPPHPPPLISGHTEPYKFLLKNVPNATPDEIREYFDDSKLKIMYSKHKGTVMVEYPVMPEYEDIFLLTCTSPLKDRMMTLQKLLVPTRIQIGGVTEDEEEEIVLHFESAKHGGDEINHVEWVESVSHFIIDFGDPKVVKSVLQQQHRLSGNKLTVRSYYPEFGIISDGHDTTRPWDHLPEPLSYHCKDSLFFEFCSGHVATQGVINDMCAEVGCQVCWESSIADKLVAKCTDTTVKDKALWEKKSRAMLSDIMETIRVEKISALTETFNDIQGKVNEETKDKIFLVREDVVQSLITIVGWKPDVQTLMNTLNPMVKEIEDKFNWKKGAVDEVMKLSEVKLQFLDVLDIKQQMNKQFPSMDMAIELDGLSFKGFSEDIKSGKLFIYEIVEKMCSSKHTISEGQAHLMSQNATRSYILDQLKDASVPATWTLNQEQLILWSNSDNNLTKANVLLKKYIAENQIPLQDHNMPVLDTVEWQNFVKQLASKFDGKLYVNTDVTVKSMTVVGTVEVMDPAMEDIVNYLDEFSIITRCLPTDRGIVRLIFTFHKERVNDILLKFKGSGVSIEENPDGEAIVVKGNKHVINHVAMALDQMLVTVIWQHQEINIPGMAKFFESSAGREALDTLEMKYKVTCELGDSKTRPQMAPLSGLHGDIKEVWSSNLPNGCVIRVLSGDMTKHRCDAIVNAANTKLLHGGGLAGAIVKAGGNSIQEECNRYTRQNGELQTGQVFIGRSGNLPCKKIIHAVGPIWKGGTIGEGNELYEVVYRSLEVANNDKLTSVAFPAISTGIYRFPLDEATEIICTSVVDFLEGQTSSVKEIHLMDTSSKCTKSFQMSLERCVKKKFPGISGGAVKSFSSEENFEDPWIVVEEQMPEKRPVSRKREYLSRPDTSMETTPEGMSITVKRGSLENEQVDMLVNTTTHNLQLNAGGVSGAIFHVAGPGIQQECHTLAPNGIKHGQVVITSGGNTAANFICHGSCGNWDKGAGNSEKYLRNFIQSSLNNAHIKGCVSVAFPAIGTGNNKYPADTVAKVMKEEITGFSKSHPGTSVKDVRIILFPQDQHTIQAFEKLWLTHVPKRPENRTLAGKSPSVKDTKTCSMVDNGDSNLAAKFADVLFTLKMGNITKEHCDVIVNSTDSAMNLRVGAVSKAILAAGGPKIQAECIQYVQLNGPLEDLMMTNAGKLPCKNIIHINAPKTLGQWEKLILQTLTLADSKGLKSIAFPAVGTGSQNNPGASMADTILKAVTKFSMNKPQHLQNIRVTVFDQAVFDVFKKQMVREITGKGSGVINKITNFFKGLVGKSPEAGIGQFVSVKEMMKFRVYSFMEDRIGVFITKVEELGKSQTSRHAFDDPEDQTCIRNMTHAQLTEIQGLMERYPVDIDVDMGVITVEGMSKDVVHCVAEISKIIKKIQKQIEEENTAELWYLQVRWQYETSPGNFKDYSSQINYIIEKAFLDKKPTAEWEEEDGTFEVEFAKETERPRGNPSSEVTVKRTLRDAATGTAASVASSGPSALPSTWTPMQPGEKFRTETLTAGSPEFQVVAQSFFAPGNIRKIERLQNPELFALYELRKKQMTTSLGNAAERTLYHGTSVDTLKNINTNGMNRSYSGKHATAYGCGVYFAVDSRYSASPTYAKPDLAGQKYMYQCKVLVGEYTQGNNQLKEPPEKNPNTGTRYNSVVDRVQQPTMFIIFHDAQVYPEYIITFT